jgi:hypothetical protein
LVTSSTRTSLFSRSSTRITDSHTHNLHRSFRSLSIRIGASLARVALRDLESKGLIKKISTHNSQLIYTRATKEEEGAPAEAAKAEKKPAAKKGKAKKGKDEEEEEAAAEE